MSKYKSVYKDIQEKINKGILKAGMELMSEQELADHYAYSKDTIRKALSLLEMNGYIQKFKGKNSIILAHGRTKNTYLSALQTSEELNQSGDYNIITEVLELSTVEAKEQPFLAELFPKGSSLYKVRRNRSIDQEKLEYDELYFSKNYLPELTEKEAGTSIYHYLEEDLGLKISHAHREISFRYATKEERSAMDLGDFDMVVVITSIAYLSNGAIFQYGRTSYRPDKFTFSCVAKR